MSGVDWVDPGLAGFVLGGLLILAALALLWLLWSGRRARAEVVAEVQPSPRVGCAEPVTLLMARVSDAPDATQVMPAMRGGGRG